MKIFAWPKDSEKFFRTWSCFRPYPFKVLGLCNLYRHMTIEDSEGARIDVYGDLGHCIDDFYISSEEDFFREAKTLRRYLDGIPSRQ